MASYETPENKRPRSSPHTPVTPDEFLQETKLVILSYLGLIPPHLHPHNVDWSSESDSITSTPDSASISSHLDFNVYNAKEEVIAHMQQVSHHEEEMIVERQEDDFDSIDTIQMPPATEVTPESQREELVMDDAGSIGSCHDLLQDVTITTDDSGDSSRAVSSKSVHINSIDSSPHISPGSSDVTLPSFSASDTTHGDSIRGGVHSSNEGRSGQSFKVYHDRSKSADMPHLASAVHKKLGLRLDLVSNTVSEEIVTVATEARQSIQNIRGISHQGSGHRVISPSGACCQSPMTPQTAVARRLALLGDQICQDPELNRRLQEAIDTILTYPSETLTYDIFQNTASHVMGPQMPGGKQVALLLRFTKLAAVGLTKSGTSGIGRLTEYTTKLIAERTADFILQNGGWDAVANVDLDHIDTNPLFSSSDTSIAVATSPLEPQLSVVYEDISAGLETVGQDQTDAQENEEEEKTASYKPPVEEYGLRYRERSHSVERSDESVFMDDGEVDSRDFDSNSFGYYTSMAVYSIGVGTIAAVALGVLIWMYRRH